MDTPQTKRPLFYLIVVLVLSLVQASCSFSTSAVPTVPANESVVSTETLPAPASPTATKLDGPLLVVINPIADENIDLQNSFLLTANGFGANAKKYDGSFDTNQEISLVNDAIAAGAKGIAIQVFSPVTSLGPTISKAAKEAGVTLIAITTSIKDESGNRFPSFALTIKTWAQKSVKPPQNY
jgi:ABC-type sugar transport system substrate-binding protein